MFSPHPFWTSSSLDVPAGVTQEEGHTGFLIHLPSAVRALIFVARRIQPFLSLVDREVEFDGTPIPLFGSQYCCPILKGNEAKWRDFFCLRRRLQRGPSPAGGPFLAPPPRFARLPIYRGNLGISAAPTSRYILYRCCAPIHNPTKIRLHGRRGKGVAESFSR